MNFRRLTLVSALVAAATSFLVASTALAAPPYSSPSEIVRVTMEPGAKAFDQVAAIGLNDLMAPQAYWGKTTAVKHGGSQSLWCAGLKYPSGSVNAYGQYLERTRGTAVKVLPELADYYSSSLSFYYLYPSRGAADSSAFGIGWGAVGPSGELVAGTKSYHSFPLTSSWLKSKTFDLAAAGNRSEYNLSRTAGRIAFDFYDSPEWTGATTGVGPSIDDIVVSGYKYGPVRNVVASFATDSGVALSWTVPAESTKSTTADSRPIAYRIWRAPLGTDAWTELTSGRDLTSTSFIDATAKHGGWYDYVVQAWDVGTGSGHSTHSTPKLFVVPAAEGGIASSVSLTAPSTSSYGSAKLTGYVKVGASVLKGRQVMIEESTDKVRWSNLKFLTSSSTSGLFSYTAAPTYRRYYRVRYAGDDRYAASYSTVRAVLPRVYFSDSPRFATYTHKYGSTYTTWGYFKPQGKHPAGSSTQISVRAYRYESGKWVYKKTFTMKTFYYNTTYTKYSGSVKLPSKGTWRLRARHAADSYNAETFSSYRKVYVK